MIFQYFSYISSARQALINDMQSNLGRVTKLNEETANALKEVVNLKSKQETERKNLESQKQVHSKVVQKLSSQISTQRNEIEKLKREKESKQKKKKYMRSKRKAHLVLWLLRRSTSFPR